MKPLHSLLVFALACGSTSSSPVPQTDGGDAADPDADALATDGGADAGISDAGTFEPRGVFREVRREAAECPFAAARCAATWPSGEVTRFVSEERYGDLTHERTFYVVVPEGELDAAPMWIYLHGGYGNAIRTMTMRPGVVDIAAGNPIAWSQNTESCRYDPYASPPEFRTTSGDPCAAASVSGTSRERAIAVFPEGILDAEGPGRHWEDGRVPSPGFGTEEELRDDVGFLDHIVRVLIDQTDLPLDPARVYVGGVSNGGTLSLRLACYASDPELPGLARVAALGSLVASFAEAVALGQSGRRACDRPSDYPMIYVAGRGFGSPDVDGDGFVPWGEPGGRYLNNSPDGGWRLGVDDSLSLLVDNLERAGLSLNETSEPVGFYTQHRRWELDGEVRLEFLGTDGGAHAVLGTRQDFHPLLRVWGFVSRFRRDAEGTISTRESAASGVF